VKATGSAPRPPTHSNLSLDGSSAKFASDLTNRYCYELRSTTQALLLPSRAIVTTHASACAVRVRGTSARVAVKTACQNSVWLALVES
jgi:hypothetical protein